MSIAIMSWNNGRGARELSRALTRRGLLLHRNRLSGIRQTLIINWGLSKNSRLDNLTPRQTLLNSPQAVCKAADKLISYRMMEGIASIPEWTTDPYRATQWAQEDGQVMARYELRGNSGSGIQLQSHEQVGIVPAPLYTRLVNKTKEYRVHCTGVGQVIDVRRKAKRNGYELTDTGRVVWNHGNGFVFKIEGVVPDSDTNIVCREAIKAVQALGLDFGAVDIGYNHETQQAWVFEVNTAPGLEGSTVQHYANWARSIHNGTPFVDWRER